MAAIGSSAQRPGASPPSSRTSAVIRRRLVVAALVLVSLALVTVYFRESDGGALHSLQSAGAAVLRPFEVAAERVARPFRDAAGWFGGLLDAKSENEKLREEVERLRQQLILSESAVRENSLLRSLLVYREGPRFPRDYRAVAARVVARPPSQFEQQIVISAGKNDGLGKHDAVVTSDGLVGLVTKVASSVAQVTLLTDETSAVSAVDIRTNAAGIVRHGRSGGSLVLDRVTKDLVVNREDVVVTAGWRSGELASLYPRGLPIGVVTSVGQVDTDIYKQIQIEPFVDFGSLESVLVLVRRRSR